MATSRNLSAGGDSSAFRGVQEAPRGGVRPSRRLWETHKDEIRRLYIDQGKPLTQVMYIMSRKGFRAPISMYRYRLDRWGFTKYRRQGGDDKEKGKGHVPRFVGEHVPQRSLDVAQGPKYPGQLHDFPEPPHSDNLQSEPEKKEISVSLEARLLDRRAFAQDISPQLLQRDSWHPPTIVPPSDSNYRTASYCDPRHNEDDLQRFHDWLRDPPSPVCDDTDDTRTTYSDPLSLFDPKFEGYVSVLVNSLIKAVHECDLTESINQKLCVALPELLKSLALKVGFEASSAKHHGVMIFIYKHRGKITSSFEDALRRAKGKPKAQSDVGVSPEASSTEVMDRWLQSTDGPDFREDHHMMMDDVSDGGVEDGGELSMPSMEEYRDLILNDPGYDWLVSRLQREMTLSTPQQNVMAKINKHILNAISRTKHFRRESSPQGCKVKFCVNWDPIAFFEEQNYDEEDSMIISKAVTITGSCRQAQASSCSEYLAQTWPLTGPHMVRLIEDLFTNHSNPATEARKTQNGTTLRAFLASSVLVVEVSGIPGFVAEIGEQLAWLGAALRTSSSQNGVLYCVPFLTNLTPMKNLSANDRMDYGFNMDFIFHEPETPPSEANGRCWNGMFRSAVIAQGFPIPLRQESDTGLEMPLNLMTALIRTRYIDTFHEKIFIKGFSAMLVPTKRLDDVLVWHLLYNTDGNKRISYLDCQLEHAQVTISELEATRHVVGWCLEAVCNVGASTANYNIRRSGLPYASSHYVLEKSEITAGQFVTATANFALGKKETPIHISRFGYMNQMQWISSKYVNLWDEGDKRGWLVNGASVLLHLLRASLHHSKARFLSAFLLDPASLPDMAQPGTAVGALEVLLDEENRGLRLYLDKSEVIREESFDARGKSSIVTRRQTRYFLLEDRIVQMYNILEKFFDHQADVERKSGIQINPHLRRQLEGWDFQDLVKDGDPFIARVAKLHTGGRDWVEFTKAIRTVTLFGKGFGELFRPKALATNVCPPWTFPLGKYYLAVCMADLNRIMEEQEDFADDPTKSRGMVPWHLASTFTKQCPCIHDSTSGPHEPVHILFPSGRKSKPYKMQDLELANQGAVIFRHDKTFAWQRKQHDNATLIKGNTSPRYLQEPQRNTEQSLTITDSASTPSTLRTDNTESSTSNSPPSSVVEAVNSAGPSDDASPPATEETGPRWTKRLPEPLDNVFNNLSLRKKKKERKKEEP